MRDLFSESFLLVVSTMEMQGLSKDIAYMGNFSSNKKFTYTALLSWRRNMCLRFSVLFSCYSPSFFPKNHHFEIFVIRLYPLLLPWSPYPLLLPWSLLPLFPWCVDESTTAKLLYPPHSSSPLSPLSTFPMHRKIFLKFQSLKQLRFHSIINN